MIAEYAPAVSLSLPTSPKTAGPLNCSMYLLSIRTCCVYAIPLRCAQIPEDVSAATLMSEGPEWDTPCPTACPGEGLLFLNHRQSDYLGSVPEPPFANILAKAKLQPRGIVQTEKPRLR